MLRHLLLLENFCFFLNFFLSYVNHFSFNFAQFNRHCIKKKFSKDLAKRKLYVQVMCISKTFTFKTYVFNSAFCVYVPYTNSIYKQKLPPYYLSKLRILHDKNLQTVIYSIIVLVICKITL